MIRLIVNAETEAQLAAAGGPLEICGESGRTLGVFQPATPPGGLKALSPFSDEEIQRRRQNRVGRPLADILHDLEEA